MRFKALAFDLDGTLVDSKIDFTAIRNELGLRDGEPILEALSGLSPEHRASAMEIVHHHEYLGAEESSLIEGAREFILRLRDHQIPCAVFTRNSRITTEWSLQKHEIPFDFVVAREDEKPKPAPDGLWKIAKTFAVEPASLLFVGDYVFDLQAGLRAGTPTALYLPETPDFSTDGAHFVFRSYDEVAAWFFKENLALN